MPELRNYSVFISHAWDYHEDYYRLVSFLDAATNFVWTNLSVPRHDPILNTEQLAKELHNQMRPAHIFVILGGMYVAHSDWIQYEINFARRIGKPIVGIRPWASTVTPIAVQNGADEVVGWNSTSIVSAIRRHALSVDAARVPKSAFFFPHSHIEVVGEGCGLRAGNELLHNQHVFGFLNSEINLDH